MNTITNEFKTDEVLQMMMMEDTGINLCDSGGEFNRHWQRNGDGEFVNKPPYHVDEYDQSVTLSLYHYLLDRLEYSPFQMEQYRYMFPDQMTGMGEMIEYVEASGFESTGEVVNTYNYDTLLDQNVQYIEYTINDGWGGTDTYVILQTHNGADPRGGYSEPWIFKAIDGEDWIYECNDDPRLVY